VGSPSPREVSIAEELAVRRLSIWEGLHCMCHIYVMSILGDSGGYRILIRYRLRIGSSTIHSDVSYYV